MSPQLSLELTTEAINRAEGHADPKWLDKAYTVVERLARTNRVFTTDHVWRALDGYHTHEPRALGAVMRQAVKDRLITSTGTYVKSSRPECHRRPIPVYVGVVG